LLPLLQIPVLVLQFLHYCYDCCSHCQSDATSITTAAVSGLCLPYIALLPWLSGTWFQVPAQVALLTWSPIVLPTTLRDRHYSLNFPDMETEA
jgi:hypothetical protein